MTKQHKTSGLEIGQDLTFQERLWTLQRFGWGIIACIIVAGLAGVFGQGPLAARTSASPRGTFHLEYERFLHYRTLTHLRLYVSQHPQSQEEVRAWHGRSFIQQFTVTHIMPLPIRTETDTEGVTYIFRVVNQRGPVLLSFILEPQTIGSLSGRVGIDENDTVAVKQFVYP